MVVVWTVTDYSTNRQYSSTKKFLCAANPRFIMHSSFRFYHTLLIFWRAPLLPRMWLSIIRVLHLPTWQPMRVTAQLLPLYRYRQIWEQDQEFANNLQSQQSSTQVCGSECCGEATAMAISALIPIFELVPSILLSQEFCLVSEDTASPVH